ncbi:MULTISPECIES: DUF4148 domain-containing protein [Paraburkholderia]|uniref:DUF4148 domain-containing protein n=1 Tax=Paraburkholderia youngii TaxID=2782701 RepID=A0A7Y6JVC5_9BURK|nr:DUF4148 domain-containing protein [Paraburkholderia youngii]NUX98507.1 DUF4148 domain-containing protein [Paraburkholderia youngii]
MKSFWQAVGLAAAIVAPIASFAQSEQPVTRAQVKAEILQLEQNGYNPANALDAQYPADIQAAEAKIAAQDSQQAAHSDLGGATTNATAQASQQAGSNEVGGTTVGTSASGSAQHVSKPSPSSCIGPASYCNLFFGN